MSAKTAQGEKEVFSQSNQKGAITTPMKPENEFAFEKITQSVKIEKLVMGIFLTCCYCLRCCCNGIITRHLYLTFNGHSHMQANKHTYKENV